MRAAFSKGRYFNAHIRDRYPSVPRRSMRLASDFP